MTDKEKAVVMAHTGICMLTGDKFQIFHKYVENIMGRPIMTHEMGWLADEIKKKSKADFIVLCAEQEPCEDCISRKAVLDKIKEVCFSSKQEWVDFRVSQGSNGQRDLIINFIKDLPSVQLKLKTGHWIPVSEKLPEEDGEYLVTIQSTMINGHRYLDTLNYAKDLYEVDDWGFREYKGVAGWYELDDDWEYYFVDGVVAWMPLPEPYEPQENCDACKHKDEEWDSEHCDGCCGNHSGFEPQESEDKA